MPYRHIKTIANIIYGRSSGNRNDNRAGKQPSFDTTTEDDAGWEERYSPGDARLSADRPGKSRDNF